MKRLLLEGRNILMLCAMAASLPLMAQSQVSEVLSQIERHNPTLQSLAHDEEATLLEMRADNAVAVPQVEYSPFYQRGYSGVAESELVVSEELSFPTRYVDRRRQRQLEREVLAGEYRRQRCQVLLEARLLCFDVICANQTLQMLEQRLHNSRLTLQMFEKRMEAGDANLLEVNKVKLDCMEVQTLLAEASSQRIALLQQLQELNGGEAVTLTDTEYPEMPPIDDDYASFVSRALAGSADLQKAEAGVRASEHGVSMTRREWLPNVTVGYRRNTDRGEGVNGLLMGLSFPVAGNASRVKAARHRQASASIQAEQTRMQMETSLRANYDEWQHLRRVLDHSDVQMMRQTLQLLDKALQYGEISALQYYTETNSIYEKLQAHIDVHCRSLKLCAVMLRNEMSR